ncbi:MAG: NACHT domain-containing protein [Candidatus Moduliflexus flocculans]|nr:NACHT domain-containing protein [Candidatus Moduliflexus flocculans]
MLGLGQSPGHHRRTGFRQDDGAAAHGLGAGVFAAQRQSEPAARIGPLMKPALQAATVRQGRRTRPRNASRTNCRCPSSCRWPPSRVTAATWRATHRRASRTLAYFISHHLISKQADFDLPADFFVQLLQDGRDVLLLLDGLDEVANEDERAEVRQSVEELASGREALRVVVTCRTIAYRSGRTALGADFREIAVQPLDPEQHIAPMVHRGLRLHSPARWRPCGPSARTTCWMAFNGWKQSATRAWANRPKHWWTVR